MNDIANTWCRMWNDEPSLVGSIATDDIRVWFGGAGSPDVAGSTGLADFVARFRAERGVRFTPLTVATDDTGDRLAYTWHAHFPDGTDHGGIDYYTIRDGRVAENWSVLAGPPHTLVPRAPGGSPMPASDIAAVCEAWPQLWNGEIDARKLVDPDFGIWFGAQDQMTGADAFAGFVDRHRAERPGLTYAIHRDPLIDTDAQRAAMTWTVTRGDQVLGGIDLLQFADSALAQVWSVTGEKGLTF